MEKRVAEILETNSLNPYERGLLTGIRSRGSKAVHLKAISEAVANVLDSTIELDGQQLSVAEALTVKVVGEVLANPSTSKLKDLASILGDVGAVKVEIAQSAIDEELARAAIGDTDV